MQASAPPKNKLLKVHSAPVELTPLSRLARFKEIRDRNLARSSSAQNPKNFIRRGSDKMLNVSDAPPNTNGVSVATNGDSGLVEAPVSPAKAKPVNTVTNGASPPKSPVPSPKKSEPSPQRPASAQNGVGGVEQLDSAENGVEGGLETAPSVVQPQQEEKSDVVALSGDQIENEVSEGESTERENSQESEGSSLDVVVDESSSGDSLDLNVTSTGTSEEYLTPLKPSLEDAENVPGPSKSVEKPALNVDEPYIPDVIKRLNSGGHISGRPPLRSKRRQEDDPYLESARKRRCDTSSSLASLSTSWQFFSPSSALKRVWNRQGEPAPKPEDDSMMVNVSANDPQKSQKWCRIM